MPCEVYWKRVPRVERSATPGFGIGSFHLCHRGTRMRLALWNSARLGWVCLALLLLLGLPLFLRKPLWCDVTLYDVAARNLLQGGIHYRDVFDTNMPGVVWIHALVRGCLGWSSEAMRLFDVLVLT